MYLVGRTMTNFNRTSEIPVEGELWLTYHEFKNDSRIAVMECLGRLEDSPDHLPPAEEIRRKMTGSPIKGRYLWDPDHHVIGEVGHAISNVKWLFRLPEDPEDFDDEYRSLLDYVRGYLTKEEIAELLTGAESFHSGGETGYEALRRWSLTGSFDSVTEYSVGHGHGPSRYGLSVENQLDEMPQHLIEDYLGIEKERWTGGFWEAETASYVVEVLLLKDEYTDEDVEDEITEIVNEYDLEYDEYRELDGGDSDE